MKICLVHDDFCQAGGAESLFATITQIFPDAPIYTSLIDWQKLPKSLDPKRVKTSFIQKIPYATKFFKVLLPLYPLAFESFNFDDYDLVISSTTRFAKAIITKPQTVHISYVNSIPRFLWEPRTQSNYLPPAVRFILKPFFKWLKKWDMVTSARPDAYIANSKNIQEKIKKIYGRKSQVVYPFAATNFYTPAKIHNWQLKNQKYFLIVTRLVKWKKIDIAIGAAIDLKFPLYIIGDGPDAKRLISLARNNKNIKFIGKVSPRVLRDYYRNSKCLIITQNEDFGIATVEAQSCGVPVVAFSAGGVMEIIKDDKTGIFFEKQTPESLKDAISRFNKLKWKVSTIRNNALRFSRSTFVKEFKQGIQSVCPNPLILK
ncbi:hypothetical protein A3A60_03390 [Candidatus Curtissbacteria bacterium RIFCSPLOWO2_01_FULL_42_26]|uniref:Glycosyl transferase family 1 domain-containing protein n=1 Tax=Candidatus Curtissbacteria bacterium RIFCSPLOWO2_01_FULL_42_26 TaxID=1797729 RepID=A0A1F5I418_9BACT|nr:MAG: hypothetical protein A3A60_03390 [Candidatus Curtissbacteria bacterium RIFCSPLOWO2_01_FULL_42_26]